MSDPQDAAAWLVRVGYPIDWDTIEAPPPAPREAIIDAVHADPTGNLHGHELSREDVAAYLAFESASFTPTTEPKETPS